MKKKRLMMKKKKQTMNFFFDIPHMPPPGYVPTMATVEEVKEEQASKILTPNTLLTGHPALLAQISKTLEIFHAN